MYKIGVDVGGMSIKAGILKDGEIIDKLSVITNVGDANILAYDIEKLIKNLLKNSKIEIEKVTNIGVGFPGVVTDYTNVTCVNLNLINENIAEKLQDKFSNIKIKIGNDANVAALAEQRFGSMKNYKNGVMITLGTGIGGGVIINNELIAGTHGIGAEIGHTIIGQNYYDCNCGKNGCFETFCSATAIMNYAKKLLEENNDSILFEMCGNNLENTTAKMVFDAYRKNDELAKKVLNRFDDYLAIGLSNIINFLDPEVICIGGGVSGASDIILSNIYDRIRRYIPFKESKIAKIVIAEFKNDAGIIGASEL